MKISGEKHVNREGMIITKEKQYFLETKSRIILCLEKERQLV